MQHVEIMFLTCVSVTECRSQVASTPGSYLEGPGLKSQLTDQIY
jgi:hypothetical protein